MVRLFGFTLRSKSEEEQHLRSPVAPTKQDSAIEIGTPLGGANQRIITNDHSFKSENELINKYREAAGNPEVDAAIEEIVGDAIVFDDQHTAPVWVKFADESPISDKIQKVIQEEFEEILSLLDFQTAGHDIFRRWYIDGRIHFHKVINESHPEYGIQQLRYIDPRKIKRVREYTADKNLPLDQFSIMNNKYKEYWVFSDEGVDSVNQSFLNQAPTGAATIVIARDSIAWTNSGIFDPTGKMIISRLHKALRILNQYRMLEDAAVIYHLTHSVVRRKFKISVNNLTKAKAEQAMRDAMREFKNKLTYNSGTGEINEDRRFMAVTEDFWFAVRDNEQGSDVEQFEGGNSMGEVDQVVLFRNKLLNSLDVPASRLDQENSPIVDLGSGASQISREELKFARFIEQLRSRFSLLFFDLLKTQLVLKGTCTPEEFEEIEKDLIFEYARDSYFAELKEIELANQKIASVMQAAQVMGDLSTPILSREWVYKNLLRFDEAEIKVITEQVQSDLEQAMQLSLQKQEQQMQLEQKYAPVQDNGPVSEQIETLNHTLKGVVTMLSEFESPVDKIILEQLDRFGKSIECKDEET